MRGYCSEPRIRYQKKDSLEMFWTMFTRGFRLTCVSARASDLIDSMLTSGFCSCVCCDWCSKMFPKTSLTSLIVGVFLLYVLHTCWVMFGIVYTKPCEKPQSDSCISPHLAGKPRLQVRLSAMCCPMWTCTAYFHSVHVKPGPCGSLYSHVLVHAKMGLLMNK